MLNLLTPTIERKTQHMVKIAMMTFMTVAFSNLSKHCVSNVMEMLDVRLLLEIRVFLQSVRVNLHHRFQQDNVFLYATMECRFLQMMNRVSHVIGHLLRLVMSCLMRKKRRRVFFRKRWRNCLREIRQFNRQHHIPRDPGSQSARNERGTREERRLVLSNVGPDD